MVSIADFSANSTNYSGEFHVVFEYFEDLEREIKYLLPPGLLLPHDHIKLLDWHTGNCIIKV